MLSWDHWLFYSSIQCRHATISWLFHLILHVLIYSILFLIQFKILSYYHCIYSCTCDLFLENYVLQIAYFFLFVWVFFFFLWEWGYDFLGFLRGLLLGIRFRTLHITGCYHTTRSPPPILLLSSNLISNSDLTL